MCVYVCIYIYIYIYICIYIYVCVCVCVCVSVCAYMCIYVRAKDNSNLLCNIKQLLLCGAILKIQIRNMHYEAAIKLCISAALTIAII